MNAKKHAGMMRAFDAFAARIAQRYAEVRDCLDAGRYEEAQELLADLTRSHAKTSLSLRGVLIRDGVLKEDDK